MYDLYEPLHHYEHCNVYMWLQLKIILYMYFFHAICTKKSFGQRTPQNKGSSEVLSYCIYNTEIKLCQKTPLKIGINF